MIQSDSVRHEEKNLMLSIPLDFSCANIRPRTVAAITQRKANQDNLEETEYN